MDLEPIKDREKGISADNGTSPTRGSLPTNNNETEEQNNEA
jgi:hypothetical protein